MEMSAAAPPLTAQVINHFAGHAHRMPAAATELDGPMRAADMVRHQHYDHDMGAMKPAIPIAKRSDCDMSCAAFRLSPSAAADGQCRRPSATLRPNNSIAESASTT